MYKDLLVTLDAAPQSLVRLEVAARLAERFGAHLVGLYTATVPEAAGRYGYFDPALLDPLFREVLDKSRAEADRVRGHFEECVARRGVSAEWRMATGFPSETTAVHGRYADLVVLGQIDPDDGLASLVRPVPQEVALAIGRPILTVPYAGKFAEIGRRVLVGWDAGREATRAINDALPLLAAAQSVTVLAIDPESGFSGHGEVPGADIALHLARHGVKATIERTVSARIGAGETLLSRASDLDADLLVMGAYAHSRVRELLLGGATRTVLESMTVPVLMSH
jgi:nucleotide-binding universal stress UspA family protein